MTYDLVKTGSCSIILGQGNYKDYLPMKKNKLVKISKIIDNHNEFTNLSVVRKIENYDQYYSIPDEDIYMINPSNDFYKHIRNLCAYEECNIFSGTLSCFYIDFAGDKELLDTIGDIEIKYDFGVWKSYNRILKFCKQIMTGLKFLHDNKLCHLDIKPENIMVNTKRFRFKIIDFGFCSKEPFQDFINNTKGTPGYFPKYIPGDKITPWFPKIDANDFIGFQGVVPINRDFKQVYKIDSYCFGRVLNFLKYVYDDNRIYLCYNSEVNKGEKLEDIKKDLLEPNCWTRKTITECLNKYF